MWVLWQMSSHFSWYPSNVETVVQWNARYAFPSQSNKAEKTTPRIPPKSGSAFSPGAVIRIELPASGYMNGPKTTLEFDVTLYGTGVAGQIVRFENNIMSIFSRIRLLYGSTPLEDIIQANTLVRGLGEWTATNCNAVMDQNSLNGIGGYILDANGGTASTFHGNCNVRQKYIQGISPGFTYPAFTNAAAAANFVRGNGFGVVGTTDTPPGVTGNGQPGYTRRYQVTLPLGVFQQPRLVPLKFMASSLAVELTLEQPAGCIFTPPGPAMAAQTLTVLPTYGVGNVNLIPEILMFDASYGKFFCLQRCNVFGWFEEKRGPTTVLVLPHIYRFYS